jgi:hypothetical protein
LNAQTLRAHASSSLRQDATKESLEQWVSVVLGGGTLGWLPVDMIKKSQDIDLLRGSGTIPGTSTIFPMVLDSCN